MAELNKYGNKWLNGAVLLTRTAYRTAYAYCVRVLATGNGQEKEKKGKGDNKNNEKNVGFIGVFYLCGNRAFQKC